MNQEDINDLLAEHPSVEAETQFYGTSNGKQRIQELESALLVTKRQIEELKMKIKPPRMETEIIDRLFLELSQCTHARTAREIALLKQCKLRNIK